MKPVSRHQVNTVAAMCVAAGWSVATKTYQDRYGDADAAVELENGYYIQLGDRYYLIFRPAPVGCVLGALIAEIEELTREQALHDVQHAITQDLMVVHVS